MSVAARAGGTELLQSESTPNPVLYRFMDAVTRRALVPLAALPAADPLAVHILEPPVAALPAAAAQLEALPHVFRLSHSVRPSANAASANTS